VRSGYRTGARPGPLLNGLGQKFEGKNGPGQNLIGPVRAVKFWPMQTSVADSNMHFECVLIWRLEWFTTVSKTAWFPLCSLMSIQNLSFKTIFTVLFKLLLLLLHPFNGLFSRTTWVSRHQKGKPFWISMEQEMMGWQWYQLDHMQIICTSLQTDNHASTSPLSFYRPDALPTAQPTASKHWRRWRSYLKPIMILFHVRAVMDIDLILSCITGH